MTPEEFRTRMQTIADEDWPTDKKHAEADDLIVEALRSCGYSEGADVDTHIARWFG